MELQTKLMLENNLKELKLPSILRDYQKVIGNHKRPEDVLLELTQIELEERFNRRQSRRIKEARFPLIKTFNTFDFSVLQSDLANTIRRLMDCQFMEKATNIIFIGGTGTGKTHSATAIAFEACKKGKRVRFTTICSLINELVEAEKGKELQRLMERMARFELLVVDEVGYIPLSKEGADLIFQLFSMRHEKASIIFTTNLPFPEWNQVFGDAKLTSALLDRITHNADIVEMNGQSYRFQQTIKNSSKKKAKK